jgi:hypothetical protein
LNGLKGAAVLGFYTEECTGQSAYVTECDGFTFIGGKNQNGIMLFEGGNDSGFVGGILHTGVRGGTQVLATGQHNINIASSNFYQSPARNLQASPIFMRDGQYFGPSAPAVGTWFVGARVFNSAPAVGQPKSWVCTVAGTPGTWVSEGNL